jgi:hypothetical protein
MGAMEMGAGHSSASSWVALEKRPPASLSEERGVFWMHEYWKPSKMDSNRRSRSFRAKAAASCQFRFSVSADRRG